MISRKRKSKPKGDPVMTIQRCQIVTCPYCHGDISLNSAGLPAYFDHPEGELDINNEPAQTLLVFNNASPDREPCPHLLGIMGECATGVWKSHQQNWTDSIHQIFSYGWWRPEMEGDTGHLVFFQLLDWSVPNHLRGNIPVCHQEVDRTFSFSGDGGDPKFWSIDGHAYFCEDIPELLERGPALMDAKERAEHGKSARGRSQTKGPRRKGTVARCRREKKK
jgi:hypothetical protein